jgi:hypothetical protein
LYIYGYNLEVFFISSDQHFICGKFSPLRNKKRGKGEGAATPTEHFFEKKLDPESPYLGKK